MGKVLDKILSKARARIRKRLLQIMRASRFRDKIFKIMSTYDVKELEKRLEDKVIGIVMNLLQTFQIPFLNVLQKYVKQSIRQLLNFGSPEELYARLLKIMSSKQRRYLINQDTMKQDRLRIVLDEINGEVAKHRVNRDALVQFVGWTEDQQAEFIAAHEEDWPLLKRDWLAAKRGLLDARQNLRRQIAEAEGIVASIKLRDLRLISATQLKASLAQLDYERDVTREVYDGRMEARLEEIFATAKANQLKKNLIIAGSAIGGIIILAIFVYLTLRFLRKRKAGLQNYHTTLSPVSVGPR